MSSFTRPPRSFGFSPYPADDDAWPGFDAPGGLAPESAPGDGIAHDEAPFAEAGDMVVAATPSHSWLDLELIPSWLRPFTLDANTRFTRTPDHFLRPREAEVAPAATVDLSGRGWHFVLDPADDDSLPPQDAASLAPDAAGTEPEAFPAAPALADAVAPQVAALAVADLLEEGPASGMLLAEFAVSADPIQATAPDVAFIPGTMEILPGSADALPAFPRDGEETAGAVPADPVLAALGSAGVTTAEAWVPEVSMPEFTVAEVPMPEACPPEAAITEPQFSEAAPCEADAPPAPVEGEADLPEALRALGRLLLIGRDAVPPPVAGEQDLAPSHPEVSAVFPLPADALWLEPAADEPESDAAEVAGPEAIAAADEVALVSAEAGVMTDALAGPDRFGEDAPEAALDGAMDPDADEFAVTDAVGVDPAPALAPSPAGAAAAAAGIMWLSYRQSVTARFLHAPAAPPAQPAPDAGETPPAAVAELPGAPPAEVGGEEAFESGYELPPLDLLREPPVVEPDYELSEEFLDQSSTMLQQVLRDFGVRGEVIDANPGPVVTLYEFEPAPGVKSSRVIGLSPDIARSMSAVSARVAVVEGRNVIGIELPNRRRETVWLRELLASHEFADTHPKLGLCLGKTIGGVPVIADLARMPHLLVAGTTGSGKSVAINTMILSLLYRHTPEACRLIMIDPKMLELSVYEGIPHLLTPVVTDPKKAIIALKWAVKEMEERYKKMSRLAVRNIDGFNARVREAAEKGEIITRQVQVGFDRETAEALFEEQEMDLTPLPYIVVIVDEMADLMMVAGKEIEGAIQRLAQMARAAGIHLVMATQRPSVDVITGTIKANFPTRISFQVTSKIDSRTILGEMGAETLLGQGDMLFMAGGGRITRVHGPFVSDGEVEKVVAFLKAQGGPDYLDAVILDEAEEAVEEDEAVFDRSSLADAGGDLYEQAVAIVMRDRKASTSYIQRRLQVGYNKAASLMERMETEGIVGPANHAGKREILTFSRPD
ncbi:DNA translocase FtsK [Xanthobacter sp. AM11]|uniref:DNA translocase FtsK n=1 Tax=Xanthobacter sp. AM11 TaxID=3380643 RepID=UPI0039BFDF79